jgi:nucleotide-binding universal stress UspA family protein
MNVTNADSTDVIVVGVDGSPGADRALAWAADEAARRGSLLRIVHGVHRVTSQEVGWLASAGLSVAAVRDEIERDAEHLVKNAAEAVHAAHPDVRVHTTTAVEDARTLLLAEAADADLVVVGSRGRGPIRSLLLGSVGVTLVRQAPVPVVVVRGGAEAVPRYGVVVGTNGTESSRRSLEIAFEQAERRGVPLTVMHCLWDGDESAMRWMDLPESDPRHDERMQVVRDLVADASAAHPGVTVTIRLTRGAADRCLIDLARTAELVVVGRHGATPLDHAGLGTVSTPVVEHARTAVLVVPGDSDHSCS